MNPDQNLALVLNVYISLGNLTLMIRNILLGRQSKRISHQATLDGNYIKALIEHDKLIAKQHVNRQLIYLIDLLLVSYWIARGLEWLTN